MRLQRTWRKFLQQEKLTRGLENMNTKDNNRSMKRSGTVISLLLITANLLPTLPCQAYPSRVPASAAHYLLREGFNGSSILLKDEPVQLLDSPKLNGIYSHNVLIAMRCITSTETVPVGAIVEDIRGVINLEGPLPPLTFKEKHPLVYKASAPVRLPFRACCWIGKKAEQSGITGFLQLVGAAGSVATPFVLGVKR